MWHCSYAMSDDIILPGDNGTAPQGVAVAVVAKATRGRGRYPRIDKDKYSRMLDAWREKPTMANVMRKANVGERLARKAIYKGWPELNLRRLVDFGKDQELIYEEMARSRARTTHSQEAQTEAAKQAAEEALALQQAMANTLKAGSLFGNIIDKVNRGVETGRILIEGLEENDKGELVGQLDARMFQALTKGAHTLAAAVNKIVETERLRTGAPEESLGIEVGLLLSKCDPAELMALAQDGKIPDRLVALGGRPAEGVLEFDENQKPEDFDEDAALSKDFEDPMARAQG